MAEILGAVASGLAVAEVGLKVGGTVWKLKKLWHEVHQVPATIQDLMKQIEMMDPILSDHETTLSIQSTALPIQLPTHNGAPALQSAAYCRDALNDLRHLVEDLDGAVESEKRSRRTFARMRVVLKKDTIKGFQDRLEKATRLLQSSQLSYLAANAAITGVMVTNMWTAVTDIQAQQQLILQQLNNSNSSSLSGRPPFPLVTQHLGTSREHNLNKRKGVLRQGNSVYIPWSRPTIFGAIVVRKSEADSAGQATYAAHIQLPKWLSQKFWDISTCSGWQWSLSTWNIVPDDSPGMICVEKGDLNGLIDLFNRGLASPRDCLIKGYTIFCLACRSSHTHVVNYFINMNLDTTQTMAMGTLTAEGILMGTLPVDIIRQLSSRGSFDSLANAAEDFELLNETMPWDLRHIITALWLSRSLSRRELFDIFVHTYFPFWHNLPPSRKQEILMVGLPYGRWTADCLRLMICPDGPIQLMDAKAWNDDGASLLHVLFSYYIRNSFVSDMYADKLLEEAIQATDDVHRIFEPGYFFSSIKKSCSALQVGLMMSLESSSLQGGSPRGKLQVLGIGLSCLMSIIARCGYDLLEFGRQEVVKWVGQCSTGSTLGDSLHIGFRYNGLHYVRAVHYGAEPTDWYFEVDCHHEEYAGTFWNLIENPHLFEIPGAWIDEE